MNGFYCMNKLIFDYRLSHPEATVFRLSRDHGIVVFDTEDGFKMYNAGMELLDEWSALVMLCPLLI